MSEAPIKWTWAHTLVLPAVLVLAGFSARWGATSGELSLSWGVTAACLGSAVLVLGHGVTGRWLGAFIDERNVMSLSRFQILLWSLLILSAYLAAALYNVFAGSAQPLAIAIQKELWLLMGISTTSLVGSPLILSAKAAKPADGAEMGRTMELLRQQGDAGATFSNQGHVLLNTEIAQARWSDMFTGEEVGNAAHIDVARLQMFFFTLVAAIAYGVMLSHMFAAPIAHGITTLPALDESMVALIAISHGGYLVSKAAPHSQTGSGETAAAPAADAADDHPAMG